MSWADYPSRYEKTRTYTVPASEDQAERWEAAAAVQGRCMVVGTWLAETADAYLQELAKAGRPYAPRMEFGTASGWCSRTATNAHPCPGRKRSSGWSRPTSASSGATFGGRGHPVAPGTPSCIVPRGASSGL